MKKLQIFLNNLIRGRNLLCSWYACYRNSFTFQVLFWITLAGIAVFLLYPGRDRDTQGRQDIVLWVPRAAGDQVKACVEEFERKYLSDLLARNAQNISQSARNAGIERAYLQRLIRKYGMRNSD